MGRESLLPGLRLPAQMHDRDDQDGVGSELIEDSIRKAVQPTPAGVFRYGRPGMWMLDDSSDRSAGLCRKLIAKPFTFSLL